MTTESQYLGLTSHPKDRLKTGFVVQGMNTYAMYLFQFFILNKFMMLWEFCFCFFIIVYGV